MARKTPLGKIKDTADIAVATVVGTGQKVVETAVGQATACLLYTSPSPRDGLLSRMPSSA